MIVVIGIEIDDFKDIMDRVRLLMVDKEEISEDQTPGGISQTCVLKVVEELMAALMQTHESVCMSGQLDADVEKCLDDSFLVEDTEAMIQRYIMSYIPGYTVSTLWALKSNGVVAVQIEKVKHDDNEHRHSVAA